MSAHHEGKKIIWAMPKWMGKGGGGGGPMLYCPLQGKLSLVRPWKEE